MKLKYTGKKDLLLLVPQHLRVKENDIVEVTNKVTIKDLKSKGFIEVKKGEVTE